MNTKAFASVADLEEKPVSFERLSEHAWAYTAEGDPNTGVVIGDDSVMIIDATATTTIQARPERVCATRITPPAPRMGAYSSTRSIIMPACAGEKPSASCNSSGNR